jgi:hypothetical protein
MTRRDLLKLAAVCAPIVPARAAVLDPDAFRHYVDAFNADFKEEVVTFIPDAQAWDWMKANIPFFTCPDRDIEEIYYYRWWTYRKNIKQTPLGLLVTEFLKPVNHASDFNALSCALGHHIAEGRWLRDPKFVEQDIHFWLCTGPGSAIRPNLHQFSGWTAAAVYERWLADGNREALLRYLDPLLADYAAWEKERLTESGLFWQRDVSDGMESSISGGRRVKNIRPSINSYMYGNAKAIAEIATMAGRDAVAREYREKAARLKDLVERRLWNRDAAFFETRTESGEFVPVRENIGYTPWYFDLPADRTEYAEAWKQLMDPAGFYAPFGLTTAERRHPKFDVASLGDDCSWDGPGWPFATTITLRALANLLHSYRQQAIGRGDYFETLRIYARSQHLKRPDGSVVPFVDEDLNPLNGEWLARGRKIAKHTYYGRGDHYNHSGYCDLIVTGLAGLQPRPDNTVELDPMLPPATWDWFCLDRIPYHRRSLTVVWDRLGTKFGKGRGLLLFADGREIARTAELGRVAGRLP